MIRTFDTEPLKLRTDGDHDTVEGWIVPYGEVADVVDVDHRGARRYREGFRPQSCLRMAQMVARKGNAGFVRLTLDHSDGFHERVGCGVTLEDRGTDGAWAKFKLYGGLDLDKIRSMITESHNGFSIEFDDIVPAEEVDGVIWRRQVQIPAVTLTPLPAYTGAKVLALRDTDRAGGDLPNLAELDAILDHVHANARTLYPDK